MYLIWIFVSKLIRSNNPSRATLWVLETCRASFLNKHLDHCFVVFKHKQQSVLMRRIDVWKEKIYIVQIIEHSMRLLSFLNCVRCWTNFTLVRTQVSPCFATLIRVSPRTATIRSQKSRAGKPSNLNPASKEVISDSVELCETAVCFLHIQLIGTNVWLPKMDIVPHDVDFESSRSPAKSESWNSPSLHCLAVFPTWQYCLYSHVWWMWEIKRDLSFWNAYIWHVIGRPDVLWSVNKHARSITKWTKTCDKRFESILFRNSPTDFISSSLKWWSSMHGIDTL